MAKYTQLEFDFEPNRPTRREYRVGRPNHHTTILTTTARTFARVAAMGLDEEVEVEFVNDIISSAKGGSDNIHHSIRRAALLKRQMEGGWTKVKVRFAQGEEVIRHIASRIEGDDDACSVRVWVSCRPN